LNLALETGSGNTGLWPVPQGGHLSAFFSLRSGFQFPDGRANWEGRVRTVIVSTVYRFAASALNPSLQTQCKPEENPHSKSLRTFATPQVPEAFGLHHPLGALETTWPRWNSTDGNSAAAFD